MFQSVIDECCFDGELPGKINDGVVVTNTVVPPDEPPSESHEIFPVALA